MTKQEEKKAFKNRFGNLFGEQLVTPIGRADYVYLVEPNSHFKPEKFSVNILFKKGETSKEELNVLIKACQLLAKQEYGDKKTGFKYGAIRDGDAENEKGKSPHPGYYYIKATSATRVSVVQSKGGKNVDVDPSIITPGVQIRAILQPIMFDDGFAWGLRAVQFIKDDGTKFFHGPDPRDMFDVFSDDDEDETGDISIDEAADEALTPKGKKNGKEAALDLL